MEDAVQQYKRDRDPRELLFQFGRCVVHFAVDDAEVRFCTHLKGKASWFLPFNEGWNDGAGNPPNPDGLKTDYLWKRIFTPRGLTDILENYAQIVAPAPHQLSIICPGEISSKGRGSARILADLRSRPHHGALRASDRMAHRICSLLVLSGAALIGIGTTFWWRLSEGQTSKLPESGESLD